MPLNVMAKNPSSFLRLCSLWLLVLALFIFLRPYYGIRHDSVLYLGQALLRLRPDVFGNDVFFSFGSQADYTIFPQLMAWLLRYVQAADLFLWMTALGLALFIACSAVLVCQLVEGSLRYWALASLAIFSGGYGGYSIFSYSEPFFTARTLAEPLLLLAVAAWLREHLFAAILLVLFAALLHPLQAIAVGLVLGVQLVMRDHGWLLIIPIVVMGLLFSMVSDSLSVFLFSRYDSQWLSWIQVPNKHIFVSKWDLRSWCYFLSDVFFAVLLIRYASGKVKIMAKSLLAATAIGMLASLLLVDLWSFVLPAGIQLWRVHWLLHWFVVAMLPFLLLREYRQREAWLSVPFLVVLLVAVQGFSAGPTGTPYAVLLLIPFYWFWQSVGHGIADRTRRLVCWALVVALLLLLVKHFYLSLALFLKVEDWSQARLEYLLLSYPLFAMLVVWCGCKLWRANHWSAVGGVVFLVLALGLSIYSWDRRSPWTKYIEYAPSASSPFDEKMEKGAQVFWMDELLAPWLVLRRPSYFNEAQGSGLLFNRDTAREVNSRRQVIEMLQFQSQICGLLDTFNKNEKCELDASALKDACRMSGGQLQYLVLPHKVEGVEGAGWRVPKLMVGDSSADYYLYACSDADR